MLAFVEKWPQAKHVSKPYAVNPKPICLETLTASPQGSKRREAL